MAYQIDFTAAQYETRKWRKLVLRLLSLAAAAATVWGVCNVYTTYNAPTLNMRLAEYEMVARPIEEMNAAWDAAAKEYAALAGYYRLVWAANPTNFLEAMGSSDAPRLRSGLRSRSWALKTGGECRLDYRYVFGPGDKAEQAHGLEDELICAVTSVVEVADGKVSVQGVRHENLLEVATLDIAVGFSLPGIQTFPAKERTLTDCVNEIAAMRKRIQETKIAEKSEVGGVTPTAQGVMMTYLPIQFGKDRETGKVKPEFPELATALNVVGWLARADQFILRNRIPGDDRERQRLKVMWNRVGEARLPWRRFRALDNDELVERTKVLGTVSDGVKRFKSFLEKRQADNRQKLEPFIEAYDHGDIGNKPLVEDDLAKRAAAAAGIAMVTVGHPADERGAIPAVLEEENEKFVFTWMRWRLSAGGQGAGEGEREQQGEATEAVKPLTLLQLSDCIRRTLTLGPGYALDAVKVTFGEDGAVTGAVLEGLFPTKTVIVREK